MGNRQGQTVASPLWQNRKFGHSFYGSYMNFDLGSPARTVGSGRLSGFDICIRPRANLVPSDHSIVYGVLATATHQQLGRLYALKTDHV